MKVLVAEDDPVTRRVLVTLLRRWGYHVVAVGDGAEAWRILSEPDAPRVALLDWEMPGMDGVEICRRIRALGTERYTYLILLTGRESRSDLIDGHDAGADDYLTKPFDDAELQARLRVSRRIMTLQEDLFLARETLRHQATHDGLTGALNRTGALENLRMEVCALARRGGWLGVVMVDLDHFKRVNDSWGHAAGDAVLRESVHRIGSAIRPYDRIGRVGGEEFLVVLPGSDRHSSFAVAERIRRAVCERPILVGPTAIEMTCSVGVGTLEDADASHDILQRVDQALYSAKSAGRNRVFEVLDESRADIREEAALPS